MIDEEQTKRILHLATDGYTVPSILRIMKLPVESHGEVTQIFVDNYMEILKARRLQTQQFLETGLGSKLTRAQRLAAHIEEIEEKAQATPQWSQAYTKGIATLDKTLDQYSDLEMVENDPWKRTLDGVRSIPQQLTTTQDSDSTSLDGTQDEQIHPGLSASNEDQPSNSNSTSGEPLVVGPLLLSSLHSGLEPELSKSEEESVEVNRTTQRPS